MDAFEEAKTQSFHLKLPNRLILENKITPTTEAVAQRRPVKKLFLEISQNSQPQACNFIKKETLAQVFSCEFCEILRIPFLKEHL